MKEQILKSGFSQQMRAAHNFAESRANSMFSNRKGNFNLLSDTAKSLVVFGIMLVMGVSIIVNLRDTFTAGTSEFNEANAVVALFTDLRTWAAIVLLVIVAYIILRYLGLFDKN